MCQGLAAFARPGKLVRARPMRREVKTSGACEPLFTKLEIRWTRLDLCPCGAGKRSISARGRIVSADAVVSVQSSACGCQAWPPARSLPMVATDARLDTCCSPSSMAFQNCCVSADCQPQSAYVRTGAGDSRNDSKKLLLVSRREYVGDQACTPVMRKS